MWQSISNSITGADIFGQQFSLKLNGNQYFKTACGGYATTVLMCLCLAFFFLQFTGFVGLKNITVVQYQEFDAQPLQLETTTKKFMFAVSIQQSTPYTTNPYFAITMTSYNQTRFDNGTVVKTTQVGNLVPCTMEHWNLGGTFNWTRNFNALGLSSWLCPSLNSSTILQGAFDSTFFDYVKFQVTSCTTKFSKNCATDADRAAYLQANSAFNLQFYTSNYIVNTDKVVPDDTYMLSSLYWEFIPNVTYVETNVFMQEYSVTTDVSIMPWTQQEVLKLPVIDQREVQNFIYSSNSTGGVYAKIFLRRSYFTQIYTRQFQKLQDLLSVVGGFVQSLILICGIFLAMYNQKKLMIYLANRLYDFQFDDDDEDTERQLIESELYDIRQQYQINKNKQQRRITAKKINGEGDKNSTQLSDGRSQQKQESTQENKSREDAIASDQNKSKQKAKRITIQQSQNAQKDQSSDGQQIELQEYTYIERKKSSEENGSNEKDQQNDIQQTDTAAIENSKREQITSPDYVQSSPNVFIKNKEKQSSLENESHQNQKNSLTDHKTFLKRTFEKTILRHRKHLSLSFKYFIYSATCGKYYRTKENLMIDKSTLKVEAKLDLCTILDQLEHLDKMQKILLNKEQIVLFNFCPKQVFRLEEEQKIIGRDRLVSMYKKKSITNNQNTSMTKAQAGNNSDTSSQNNKRNRGQSEEGLKTGINGTAMQQQANDTENQVNQDEKDMKIYLQLYQAYEDISQIKQSDESKIEKTDIAQNQEEQDLPQLFKKIVQKDVNQRLIQLLGDEMNKILSTAQLIKENSNESDNYQPQGQNKALNGRKLQSDRTKFAWGAEDLTQDKLYRNDTSDQGTLDRKISITEEQLPIELQKELLQNQPSQY